MLRATTKCADKALAQKYADMARKSSKVGSKRFIYWPAHDEVQPFPGHQGRQHDNPLKHSYWATRVGWLIHDVRLFGLREAARKWYYLIDVWRNRGERIFAGMDELGNKFWFSHVAKGANLGRGGRWMEPADPHWFRGQDYYAAHPEWTRWCAGVTAYSPAMLKARGEGGMHGPSMGGGSTPFKVKYQQGMLQHHHADPTYVPQTTMIMSPWYKLQNEAGWACFHHHQIPVHAPFAGEHDVKPEVVEEFWRHTAPFCRWSRGHDHDEWRN